MKLYAIVLSTLVASAADAPRFLPASECALCHSRIPQPGQAWDAQPSIAQHPLWSGSMMAHSSVDPYWRARVRQEIAAQPARQAEIEAVCLRCHAPMQPGARLASLSELGHDGVSCTLCHQIQPANFGQPSSFTGGFQIGTANILFGPHANPFSMPMLHHTGFQPQEGRHILEAALCATCHTVITEPLESTAAAPIRFVEQAPFLEWRASRYPAAGQTCQTCHMPHLDQPQFIAHRPPGGPFPPTAPRTPFGRHEFVGANAAIARQLGLPETAARAEAQLRRALDLAVQTTSLPNGRLQVDVTVHNRTGHKLPTGFPSRRLWLHVVLADPQGKTLWESGAWDPATGQLTTGESAQPHHTVIDQPAQVQIFEVESHDAARRPVVTLLRSAYVAKDNRVLPEGTAAAPSGTTTTRYLLPAQGARLTVEAVYQTVKPSHRPSDFPATPPVVAARVERRLQELRAASVRPCSPCVPPGAAAHLTH